MSVVDSIRRPRVVRLAQFSLIGVVGMAVDLTVTFAALGNVHYLLANMAGFGVAVSHNFLGNYWLTYSRPDGSVPRQYASYVGLHSLTFGLRAVTIAALVELAGAPAPMATAVGVGVAALTNFVGAEAVFGAAGELRFDIVEAGNQFAHLVYSSRLRTILQNTGLYNPIFRLYTRGLRVAYPGAERSISVNGASATIQTSGAVETVSVLHTLEKERDILAEFVEDVEPDDHVVDAGANLGVFSALAADCGADVTAVEPHPPTAARARENLPDDARVVEAALGGEYGTVQLAVEQDAVGTQRPAVADEGEWTIDQIPVDRIRSPDVIKIDVEGAEIDVLAGMAGTLAEQACRVVYLEAHDEGKADQARAMLDRHGYAVETLAEDNTEVYLRGEVCE